MEKFNATNVAIFCPVVGEGNPATAVAVKRHLDEKPEYRTSLAWLDQSAFITRVGHRAMSQSEGLTGGYTRRGAGIRTLVGDVVGPLMALEGAMRTPEVFSGNGNRPDILITTQELALKPIPSEVTKRIFRQGAYLVISDVLPKVPALPILKNSGVRLAVWNEAAHTYLQQRGVETILVEPILPSAFDGLSEARAATKRVVVKSSGSGMPPGQLTTLKEGLDSLNLPYEIYMPNQVITNDGVSARPADLSAKIEEFFESLVTSPPRLLISSPSEMIQVAAVMAKLGMTHLSLPSRGGHEQVNYNWAEQRGVSRQIKDITAREVRYQIEKAISEGVARSDLGLGTESLAAAIQPK